MGLKLSEQVSRDIRQVRRDVLIYPRVSQLITTISDPTPRSSWGLNELVQAMHSTQSLAYSKCSANTSQGFFLETISRKQNGAFCKLHWKIINGPSNKITISHQRVSDYQQPRKLLELSLSCSPSGPTSESKEWVHLRPQGMFPSQESPKVSFEVTSSFYPTRKAPNKQRLKTQLHSE